MPRGTPIPAPIATLCEASWLEGWTSLEIPVVVVGTLVLRVRLELRLVCKGGIVDREVGDFIWLLDCDAGMSADRDFVDEVDAAVITVIVE